MKKIVPIVVIVVLLMGGIYYFTRHQTQSITPTLVDKKTALAKLQGNMQGVTPHFIDKNKGDGQAALTPEELRIRGALVEFYAERYVAMSPDTPVSSFLLEAENGIWLNAIGKRYILLTEASKFATDVILDVQTGESAPISGSRKLRYYLAPEREIALYIDSQALYTYSLDQVSATLISGSQLSGTETYHNGYIGGIGIEINPEETHTKNNITISIFDSSKNISNPDVLGARMYAKVGQKTLSF